MTPILTPFQPPRPSKKANKGIIAGTPLRHSANQCRQCPQGLWPRQCCSLTHLHCGFVHDSEYKVLNMMLHCMTITFAGTSVVCNIRFHRFGLTRCISTRACIGAKKRHMSVYTPFPGNKQAQTQTQPIREATSQCHADRLA